MAVIRFTEGDKLAGKVMEKGPYTFEVTEIDGPKASSSQKSVNYFVTVRCTTGKFMNKELTLCFNSEVRDRSLLGTQQFFPTRDFMLLAAAQQNVTLDEVPLELDVDTLKNKPFDAMIDVVTAEGNLVNVILAFLAVGKATGLPF